MDSPSEFASKPRRAAQGLFLFAALTLAAGCSLESEADYPNQPPGGKSGEIIYDSELKKRGDESVFGTGGLDLLSLGRAKKGEGEGGSGIGVNSYLWRASLDTIAFMPLASADPFGGVIITDWYVPPETPNERYKMSVYILGRQLRADGIRVAVFRQQVRQPQGWINTAVAPETATNLEDQILTRARQLRMATAGK